MAVVSLRTSLSHRSEACMCWTSKYPSSMVIRGRPATPLSLRLRPTSYISPVSGATWWLHTGTVQVEVSRQVACRSYIPLSLRFKVFWGAASKCHSTICLSVRLPTGRGLCLPRTEVDAASCKQADLAERMPSPEEIEPIRRQKTVMRRSVWRATCPVQPRQSGLRRTPG